YLDYGGPANHYTSFRPTLFLYDFAREKTYTGTGTGIVPRISTLDIQGATRIYTVESVTINANTGYYDVTVDTTGVASGPLSPTSLSGSFIYIVKSSDSRKVGYCFPVIFMHTSPPDTFRVGFYNQKLWYPGNSDPDFEHYTDWTLEAGDVIAISPMPFEWIGRPLQEDNNPGDFFKIRKVETMGVSFTSVEGTSLAQSTTVWFGTLFLGENILPSFVDFPRDYDGNIIATLLNDDPSTHLAFGTKTDLEASYGFTGTVITPGVAVVASDIDFRLVSATLQGGYLSAFSKTAPSIV
ncbi:MAG: hypothetical protein D6812_07560, partial [Deltaproteobacteria bacterium]